MAASETEIWHRQSRLFNVILKACNRNWLFKFKFNSITKEQKVKKSVKSPAVRGEKGEKTSIEILPKSLRQNMAKVPEKFTAIKSKEIRWNSFSHSFI